MPLELDEPIRATRHARNCLVDREELAEQEIEELPREFRRRREIARRKRQAAGKAETQNERGDGA